MLWTSITGVFIESCPPLRLFFLLSFRQLGGDLEQMFATSAFTDAIFRSKDLCDEPITNLQHVLPEPGHVVLQFSVRCVAFRPMDGGRGEGRDRAQG